MQHWISLKKNKLPQKNEEVLFTDGENIFKGYMSQSADDDYYRWYTTNDQMIYDVTHWMNLPSIASLNKKG